jgi:hypothetical protein
VKGQTNLDGVKKAAFWYVMVWDEESVLGRALWIQGQTKECTLLHWIKMESQSWRKVWKMNPHGVLFSFTIKPNGRLSNLWPQRHRILVEGNFP